MSELALIKKLAESFPAEPPVRIGIGDDGAVVSCSSQTVVVTDMLLDGIHFRSDQCSAQLIGRKAVAVNLSDLAAMGCRPTAAFVSVAFTDDRHNSAFIDDLYKGIAKLAKTFQFSVAGGDTNSWRHPLAINITMLGEPMLGEPTMGKSTTFASPSPSAPASNSSKVGQPVLRSTAQNGDFIFVTGPLGGSLQSGRHLTFEPRLRVAEWLMANARPTSMMDISDGLTLDLHRLLMASKVAAEIHADRIPIHTDVVANDQSQRLKAALSDGEDFELLLTLPQVPSTVPSGIQLIPIGQIMDGPSGQIELIESDTRRKLSPTGFQHLSQSQRP